MSIAGWVANYISNLDKNQRLKNTDNTFLDENVSSWAIGAKYHFSKRTQLYGGYRQTDSKNNYRDENVATLGVRHNF